MASDLENLLRNARPEFEPNVLYCSEADTLHILLHADESVAFNVDEALTIYERRDEPRVTGIVLDGVRGLIDAAGGASGGKEGPGDGLTAAEVLRAYMRLHPGGLPEGVPTFELIRVGRRHALELGR